MNDSSVKSLPNPKLLADAFSEFISASSLLENSYRALQREVGHLGTQLADRNSALRRSLVENEQMRSSLQQMIDSMPCGVLVLDTDEKIVTINPQGRELLQLENAVVRTLRDVAAVGQVDLQRMMGTVAEEAECEVCVKAGKAKRWLAISHRELSGGSFGLSTVGRGRALQSMWILRDVTASKKAEQEREATRSAIALAEVSATLAHEIRNPLASMELFASLLMDDREQTSVWVSHLRAGIRLLSATVNNVLSLHGGSSAGLVPIELSTCVRDGVEFVRPIADQAGVGLSFQGDAELKIQGNENQLRQVMLNLICNAIRHTPAGGAVDVTTRGEWKMAGFHAIVDVSDTGSGISEQQLERVFEAGYSALGNTPGLGLAVSRRLVEGHGGEIRVRSRVGSGSTFEMEFATL
jgi:two-component system sensor histidine kinase FlrB